MEETRRAGTPAGFSALASGTMLERYRIESVIGAGGFGITYLAYHVALEKFYAVKEHFPRQFAQRHGSISQILPTDPATYSWTLERFLQEGRSLARCRHPSIPAVADVFEANGTAYMVLDYIEGVSLKSWLQQLGGPPTQAQLDRIAGGLLSALVHIHRQGVLHRDIAPDNILVLDDGTACLVDFGSARRAAAERSEVMSAVVKGGFSPPEQYTQSSRGQGPWSDIYAFGATLFRAVTGKVPSEATHRLLEDDLGSIRDSVKDPNVYRPGFLAGIDHAMRLKPAQRPQSVEDWQTELMGVSPVAAPAVGSAVPPNANTDAKLGLSTNDREEGQPVSSAQGEPFVPKVKVVSPRPASTTRVDDGQLPRNRLRYNRAILWSAGIILATSLLIFVGFYFHRDVRLPGSKIPDGRTTLPTDDTASRAYDDINVCYAKWGADAPARCAKSGNRTNPVKSKFRDINDCYAYWGAKANTQCH